MKSKILTSGQRSSMTCVSFSCKVAYYHEQECGRVLFWYHE